MKYYQRKHAIPRGNLNRVKSSSVDDDPPLTGIVQGQKASDIEERFARALYARKLSFAFQVPQPVLTTMPGEWGKMLDYIVIDYRQPVEIDGEIAHQNPGQKALDDWRESQLNPVLTSKGYLPIIRVNWLQLETQELADQTVRTLFR